MDGPPRDEDGEVVPHDDPNIEDDDGIIRDVSARHVIWDDNLKVERPSSAAFSESSKTKSKYGGMSINFERAMAEDGLPADAMVRGPSLGAVRLIAKCVRSLDLQIGSEPLDGPESPNPYHGNVWGIGNSKKKKKSLAKSCEWVRLPESSM